MKKFLVSALVVGGMALIGCTRSGQNNDKGVGQISSMPGQATISPTGATTERDAYESRLENEYGELEQRAGRAKSHVTDATKAELEKAVAMLKDVRTDIHQLKTVSAESYEAVKGTVEGKLSQVREFLNRTVAE